MRNNGDGTYTEVAESLGIADNEQSWATVWQDFDNDGDFDAFCVNHSDANRFYENDGDGGFNDIIESTGINPTDLGAWENHGADFNNDGYVDILSEMARELYMNNGDMTFTGFDLPFDEGAVGDFLLIFFKSTRSNTSLTLKIISDFSLLENIRKGNITFSSIFIESNKAPP